MQAHSLAEQCLEALTRGRVRAVLSPRPLTAARDLARVASGLDPTPTVVSLELRPGGRARGSDLTESLLDALAQAAMEVYPDWYAGVELRFARARFPRAETEVRLSEARRRSADVSGAWLRAAWPRARAGRSLRLHRFSRAEEARQLTRAIDPERPLVVLAVSDQELGATDRLVVARAAEWMALQTGAPLLLFLPLSWEGDASIDSVVDDCIVDVAELGSDPDPGHDEGEHLVVRVDPPIGRPHGGSPAERRLYDALRRHSDLAALFVFNQQLMLDAVTTPRVDVLWPEGRLVIEIDGADHRAADKYRRDRHRDFELFVHGYAVLRVTNEDVLEDVERVVKKIRACIRRCKEE